MMAEFQLCPWGEEAAEERSATVGFAVGKAALHNPISRDDFVHKFESIRQSPDQMRSVLLSAARSVESA